MAVGNGQAMADAVDAGIRVLGTDCEKRKFGSAICLNLAVLEGMDKEVNMDRVI